MMELLEPYRIVRLQVHLIEGGTKRAELITLADADVKDSEFEQRVLRLKALISRHDQDFGLLTFDRSSSTWEGNVLWLNRSIKLEITVDQANGLDGRIELARTLWRRQSEWDQRIRKVAAEKLLELKNNSWLEEDEEPLTESQFIIRLAPKTVVIEKNGEIDFYCDDGELFWGHSIIVSGALETGPADAEIAG